MSPWRSSTSRVYEWNYNLWWPLLNYFAIIIVKSVHPNCKIPKTSGVTRQTLHRMSFEFQIEKWNIAGHLTVLLLVEATCKGVKDRCQLNFYQSIVKNSKALVIRFYIITQDICFVDVIILLIKINQINAKTILFSNQPLIHCLILHANYITSA